MLVNEITKIGWRMLAVKEKIITNDPAAVSDSPSEAVAAGSRAGKKVL